jgi:pimeloyl-ACP methyl ester carboxylesterase
MYETKNETASARPIPVGSSWTRAGRSSLNAAGWREELMATAVLVHGAWSSPADWRWVAECLQAQGVETVIPDLPSHWHRSADPSDDVQQVQAEIRAAAPPVTVAGWSYGGAVIGDLPDTGPIGHLVYIASIPEPASTAPPRRTRRSGQRSPLAVPV